MFDELGDNRHKRADVKTPHQRMAANGISMQDGATGWACMLMMLFKVVLKVECVFEVEDSHQTQVKFTFVSGEPADAVDGSSLLLPNWGIM